MVWVLQSVERCVGEGLVAGLSLARFLQQGGQGVRDQGSGVKTFLVLSPRKLPGSVNVAQGTNLCNVEGQAGVVVCALQSVGCCRGLAAGPPLACCLQQGSEEPGQGGCCGVRSAVNKNAAGARA